MLLVSSLLLSLSRSHLCYLWLCFAAPCLLICLFLQLVTYIFSTVCISIYFITYLFIYLFTYVFAWRYWETTEMCIRIFNHLLIFQLKCHDIPAFSKNQQFILATWLKVRNFAGIGCICAINCEVIGFWRDFTGIMLRDCNLKCVRKFVDTLDILQAAINNTESFRRTTARWFVR